MKYSDGFYDEPYDFPDNYEEPEEISDEEMEKLALYADHCEE